MVVKTIEFDWTTTPSYWNKFVASCDYGFVAHNFEQDYDAVTYTEMHSGKVTLMFRDIELYTEFMLQWS